MVQYIVDGVANSFSADDDEDNDICPVCDGECTCDNRARVLPPTPLSMNQLSTLHAASASRSNHYPSATIFPSKPVLPSLKIKLTVPPSMLGKRRAPGPSSKKSTRVGETTFGIDNDRENPSSSLSILPGPPDPQGSASGSQYVPSPKRRGRPPKAAVGRELAARSTVEPHVAPTLRSIPPSLKRKNTTTAKQKKPAAPRPPTKNKGKTPIKKAVAVAKRKRAVSSDSSELSDVDHCFDYDDDDAQSVQFPTFVSASALSSRASSSGSDVASLSGFDDSDSSIEAEEENFILSEVHDRARVRRELLGDEGQKKRDPHNAWVIRPRKKSVGPSDVEMDIDTDVTEDDDDDEEDEDEEDEEETDGIRTGVGYVGVATGWSEDDDESSFDADLFFANLSDSEAENDRSSPSGSEGGDDGDDSDLESMSFGESSTVGLIPHIRQESFQFEVTEGWDGQIVFTNGLSEGQGILDMDFEANAAQFTAETSTSPSQESDIEMSVTDVDDGGYEEDEDGGEGETTDEELIGDDDLPNERAMRLFNLPFSVSAINPMSTMSPTVSPGLRDPRPFGSPKPSDILSGKVFCYRDDHDEYATSTARSRSQSSSKDSGVGPRTGHFEHVEETRQAIIDDSHKEVPSPHPRFRRGRGASFARYSSVEQVLQKHLLSSSHSAAPTPNHSEFPSTSTPEESGIMLPELPATLPVDLNDVLEASFLDPDPSDSQGPSTDSDSRKQLKNLSRWDVIPIGAFRHTRETGGTTNGGAGWGPDTPASSTDYGSMMKASPLGTMLWQHKKVKSTKRSRNRGVAISPVIIPVRDRDGNKTPTNTPPNHSPPHHNHQNHPHKSRKELRWERKLKRKSCGPVHHHHNQQQHQHHYHNHHPNSKTRSSSSSQRPNFLSSVPSFNL